MKTVYDFKIPYIVCAEVTDDFGNELNILFTPAFDLAYFFAKPENDCEDFWEN